MMAKSNKNADMNLQVRVNYEPEQGATKAVCSATLYGTFAIRGIRVVEGKNGLFVQMPQQKDAKGNYHDLAFPVTAEARKKLHGAVLAAYEQHISQRQNTGMSMSM